MYWTASCFPTFRKVKVRMTFERSTHITQPISTMQVRAAKKEEDLFQRTGKGDPHMLSGPKALGQPIGDCTTQH